MTDQTKEIIMQARENSTRWLGLALACGTIIYAASAQAGKPVKPPKPPPEPPPPSGPVYQIIALSTLGEGSVATAINESGTVVGSAPTAGSASGMAFKVVPEPSANGPIYYRDTAPADGFNDLMVPLSGLDPTRASFANDINDAGMVVGEGFYSISYGVAELATLWLGTPPIGLGFLDGYGGENGSIAYSINNQGLIAVGTYESGEAPAGVVVPKDTNGDGVPDSWFEDADGDGFNDLFLVVAPRVYGPPPDEWPIARFTPRDINDAGQVIVLHYETWTGQLITPDAEDKDRDGNPWFADENGDGLNDLMVPLTGLDGSWSYPYQINAAGQVVGVSNGRAMLWDFTGGTQTVTDLGRLSKSVKSMSARAINDKGQIAGGAFYSNAYTTFLLQDGVMYDLAECLTNGKGWSNLLVTDINNQGCIVGSGDFNGVKQAFVAVPVTQP
jgi:uncharacterized membrane protein